MKIKEGDKFQDLKLPNIKGGECDINALRGKKSLITFTDLLNVHFAICG